MRNDTRTYMMSKRAGKQPDKIMREVNADDSFGQQQAIKDGFVMARSYIRYGAEVRTLVFEKFES